MYITGWKVHVLHTYSEEITPTTFKHKPIPSIPRELKGASIVSCTYRSDFIGKHSLVSIPKYAKMAIEDYFDCNRQ